METKNKPRINVHWKLKEDFNKHNSILEQQYYCVKPVKFILRENLFDNLMKHCYHRKSQDSSERTLQIPCTQESWITTGMHSLEKTDFG